jgi:hypothetical protein
MRCRLLHCMSPVVAHRVDSLRCEGSDAIGAKRTCRKRRERVDLTKMTQLGHEWSLFAAMHGRGHCHVSEVETLFGLDGVS